MVGMWGEHLVEHCTFQYRNPMRVFLYHCISYRNQLFSENVGCHFHFILHIMSDKAAFVSGALFCVQRYRGNLELSPNNNSNNIITTLTCLAISVCAKVLQDPLVQYSLN